MIAIFVKASWLKEIGDMRQNLIFRQEPSSSVAGKGNGNTDVVSLLAGEARRQSFRRSKNSSSRKS